MNVLIQSLLYFTTSNCLLYAIVKLHKTNTVPLSSNLSSTMREILPGSHMESPSPIQVGKKYYVNFLKNPLNFKLKPLCCWPYGKFSLHYEFFFVVYTVYTQEPRLGPSFPTARSSLYRNEPPHPAPRGARAVRGWGRTAQWGMDRFKLLPPPWAGT